MKPQLNDHYLEHMSGLNRDMYNASLGDGNAYDFDFQRISLPNGYDTMCYIDTIAKLNKLNVHHLYAFLKIIEKLGHPQVKVIVYDFIGAYHSVEVKKKDPSIINRELVNSIFVVSQDPASNTRFTCESMNDLTDPDIMEECVDEFNDFIPSGLEIYQATDAGHRCLSVCENFDELENNISELVDKFHAGYYGFRYEIAVEAS